MFHPLSGRKIKSGFVTLSAVLVLGAVSVISVSSVLLSGISANQSAITVSSMFKAKILADTCAERGLEMIHNDANFSGTNTVPVGGDSCIFTVTNLGGEARNINASATVGLVTQRVQVSTDKRIPKINVTSWKEVAVFL